MTWKLPRKLILYLSKLRWPTKKTKVFSQIEPVFLSNLWWSQNKIGLHSNWASFLSKLRWPQKKKSSLTLKRFFCLALGIFYSANLPERHEIAQNFDTILPKKYEIARNFDAKPPKIYETAQNFARNFDTLHQPGGRCPPPPTPVCYHQSAKP